MQNLCWRSAFNEVNDWVLNLCGNFGALEAVNGEKSIIEVETVYKPVTRRCQATQKTHHAYKTQSRPAVCLIT